MVGSFGCATVPKERYVCNPIDATTMAQEEDKGYTMRDMLLDHFAPATEDRQGHLKSTTDLFAIMDEHAPGRFSLNELFDLLRKEGFRDKLVGDTLMWMVAPR